LDSRFVPDVRLSPLDRPSLVPGLSTSP
jgi:hypothetical protein